MKIGTILTTRGDWLSPGNGQHPIVISSRVRLARNLAKLAFPGWAKKTERIRILDEIKPEVDGLAQMRNSFCSEKEFRICASPSTSGLISSRMRILSVFLAQPGNASLAKLRASRTRLLMTIGCCPLPGDSQSPRVVKIVPIFMLRLFLQL